MVPMWSLTSPGGPKDGDSLATVDELCCLDRRFSFLGDAFASFGDDGFVGVLGSSLSAP